VIRRALLWGGTCALVVLAGRAIAYQLAPRPTLVGSTLEQAVGGPGLVVTALVGIGGALVLAAAVLWVASLAVRERHLLVGGPAPERIRLRRFGASTLLLFCAACAAFDGLESYLHWRAGLGYHGIHCLIGPVHRDAVPILAALSLVAAALVAAARHLVAWMRRTLGSLAGRRAPRPTAALPGSPLVASLSRRTFPGGRRSRAPPPVAAPL
jgi:hypothetical protein